MTFAGLPSEWRDWLRHNLRRGCSVESMRACLVEGGFSTDAAEAALAEATAEATVETLAAATDAQRTLGARPRPDTTANSVDAAGRNVRIAACFERPTVVAYDGLLSRAECAALIGLADARFAASTVVDDEGGPAAPHPHRSSDGAFFRRGETALIAAIEDRMAALLHWPVDHGEGLQVLRYEAGGEYRAHVDYFDPARPGTARHLAEGGQRVATLIVYLNDVAVGGGTQFPTVGLQFRPSAGRAVYFADVDAAGATDPASLHAGLPVTSGVKYIATKWLRERANA